MKWVDFGRHRLKLLGVKLPSGKMVLVMAGEVSKHREKIEELGFSYHKASGLWVRRESQYRPKDFIDAFPDTPEGPGAHVVEVDRYSVIRKIGGTPKAKPQQVTPPAGDAATGNQDPVVDESEHTSPTETTEAAQDTGAATISRSEDPELDLESEVQQDGERLDVLLAQSTYLGRNKFGHKVYDGLEGRFTVSRTENIRFEEDRRDGSGEFLRLEDGEDISSCVEGLLFELEEGETLRIGDLQRFASAVLDRQVERGSDEFLDVFEKVEAALSKSLTRGRAGTLRDKFNQAVRLHQGQAYLGDVLREHAGAEVLPLPVVTAIHRVISNGEQIDDKVLSIADVRSGTILAGLPAFGDIRVFESDPSKEAAIRSAASGTVFRKNFLKVQEPDFSEADVTVSMPKGGELVEAFEVDGQEFEYADTAAVLKTLRERKEEGRSIFVLNIPAEESAREEAERLRSWIARNYAVEGCMDVDPGLAYGRPENGTIRLLAVGRKRPEASPEPSEPSMRKREAHTFADVWSWTAEVVTNRRKVAEFYASAEEEDELEADEADRNEFQVPYTPISRVGTATTMLPKNLEGATREALTKVARRYPNMDAMVAASMGMTSQQMGEVLSPEQIDALAMSKYAEDESRGFLLADQMGVGKGRTIAGVHLRNILEGYKVIFVTERDINLSDMYRDIRDIGGIDNVSVGLMNSNVSIIDDQTDDVVYERDGSVPDWVKDCVWPDEHNAVWATYSQFNRDPEDSAKAHWLREVVDENTILIIDECQNAASEDSNTAANFDVAVENAGRVFYSSGTPIKTHKNMGVYKRLLPPSVDATYLKEVMSTGGETMSEIVSAMLARDGVMLRREHDLSRAEHVVVVDEAHEARNHDYMNRLAAVLSECVYLSGEFNERINVLNRNIIREVDEQNLEERERDRLLKRLQIRTTSFGSPLYNVMRLFLMALSADKAVELALDDLRNNRKPIIFVENTVDPILEELYEDEDLAEGVVPDFKMIMHRSIRKLTRTTRRDVDGQLHVIDMAENNPAAQAALDRIHAMIDTLPDLPVSAIDYVKERIGGATDANGREFRIEEITGRSYEFVGGAVRRRNKPDRTVVKNGFNNGAIDALVINVAGSTGISLHAGAQFQDRRQRTMVMLQTPGDIAKEVQAWFRINRYDQVESPIFRVIDPRIPAASRLISMRNTKLRRMSANITSNRDNDAVDRRVPDVMTRVGDRVVQAMLIERPDLARRLMIEMNYEEENEQGNAALLRNLADENALGDGKADNRRFANILLSRLPMLSVDEQEQILEELFMEFEATIEELNAKNMNPLNSRQVHGTVHIRETNVLEPGVVDGTGSVFDDPVYVHSILIETTEDPLRAEDLAREIETGMRRAGTSPLERCVDEIIRMRPEILRPFMPEGIDDVEEAIAAGSPVLQTKAELMERLMDVLGKIRVGSGIRFSDEDGEKDAIVVDIYRRAGSVARASSYSVVFMVPGASRVSIRSLGSLIEAVDFEIHDGLNSEDPTVYDEIMERFDNAGDLARLRHAQLITGNLWTGMCMNVDHKIGSLCLYTNQDGVVQRGISVSKLGDRQLHFLPLRITAAEVGAAIVNQHEGNLYANTKLDGKAGPAILTHGSRNDRKLQLNLPPRRSKRWGFVYDDPFIAILTRRGDAKDLKVGFRIPLRAEDVAPTIEALSRQNVRLYAASRHRDFAVRWANEHAVQMEEVEDAEVVDEVDVEPPAAAMGA